MASQPVFEKIAVIGLGLIGSSVARAAREKHLATTIIGCDPNEVSLAYGRKHDFIDVGMRSPAKAVEGCNLVILATPPASLGEVAAAMAPGLMQGAIVMDVCSVKEAAIEAIAPHIPAGVDFMPAHPIAGSEQAGVSAGRADLFAGKRVIVTPAEPSAGETLQHVTAFWKGMGARVEAMPPHLHDLVYAYVSHLPQLLAFGTGTIMDGQKEHPQLQKFLRLSSSAPEIWVEIFLLNKENILNALDRYLDVIHHISSELKGAPEGSEKPGDEMLALTILFPRIVASCLITTVMEKEKKAGFPFARYAGTGFADFTSPAATPADDDIEQIAGQHRAVKALLDRYMERLETLRAVMTDDDAKKLKSSL